MDNQKKLELTLCGMLPYELKCSFTTDEIYNLIGIVSKDLWVKELTYPADSFLCKPHLHSLDKLTEPILDGGLIPIVELAKIVKNEYEWAVLRNNVCSCTFYSFTYRYNSFYLKDSSYRLVMGQLELFEKLKEWNFNIYDLPKEMYIEKSEVK